MRPENDYGNQEPSDLNPELPKNHFAQYAVYAKKYPNVNIMVSIGGWARCGYFSEMAYTAEGRKTFVESCVELIHKYPWIGGIDIDWEYPGCITSNTKARSAVSITVFPTAVITMKRMVPPTLFLSPCMAR